MHQGLAALGGCVEDGHEALVLVDQVVAVPHAGALVETKTAGAGPHACNAAFCFCCCWAHSELQAIWLLW